MHLPAGMSLMTSRRLVQSASHIGMGIRSASIRPIIILRNGGHQNSSNCLGLMKASGAQWIGMKTIGLLDSLALVIVILVRNTAALSSTSLSLSLWRYRSFIMP